MLGRSNPALLIGLLAACLASVLLATGCAAPRVDRRAYAAVPPDFALDIVVIGADRAPGWARMTTLEREGVPRALLSARFIVEPDGTLRAATGPGVRESTYPAIVQVLSRAQMLDLWRAVRNHGLLAAERTHNLVNPDQADPIEGSALYAMGIVALADRISIVVPATEASREGEGARRLIALLRAYSWLQD